MNKHNKYTDTLHVSLLLTLFDTQTTLLNGAGNDLSSEMKTFYHDELFISAEAKLVHNQFGQKVPIPAGRGKTVEFRKVSPLKKALTKLTEGVTPAGNKLDYTTILATVDQYGDFTQISDVLKTTAVDNQVMVATKRHGSQAGRTLDTVTREVITAGTNKIFAPYVSGTTETEVLLRADVKDGCYLTPDVLNYAAAKLERENAEQIGDSFVAIVHTDIARDLIRDEGWIDSHKYADPRRHFPRRDRYARRRAVLQIHRSQDHRTRRHARHRGLQPHHAERGGEQLCRHLPRKAVHGGAGHNDHGSDQRRRTV